MIDQRAGAENLLHAPGVFPRDADYHIGQFAQTEGLLHQGPDADVTGLFFGIANGNRLGKRHSGKNTVEKRQNKRGESKKNARRSGGA